MTFAALRNNRMALILFAVLLMVALVFVSQIYFMTSNAWWAMSTYLAKDSYSSSCIGLVGLYPSYVWGLAFGSGVGLLVGA